MTLEEKRQEALSSWLWIARTGVMPDGKKITVDSVLRQADYHRKQLEGHNEEATKKN